MDALTYIRGQEAPTFRILARFIRENVDRHAAIVALQKIPTVYWPAEEAEPLLENIIASIRRFPSRTARRPRSWMHSSSVML